MAWHSKDLPPPGDAVGEEPIGTGRLAKFSERFVVQSFGDSRVARRLNERRQTESGVESWKPQKVIAG